MPVGFGKVNAMLPGHNRFIDEPVGDFVMLWPRWRVRHKADNAHERGREQNEGQNDFMRVAQGHGADYNVGFGNQLVVLIKGHMSVLAWDFYFIIEKKFWR